MSEYSAVRVGKLKLKGGKGTLGGKKRKRKRHHSKSEETGEGPLRHGERGLNHAHDAHQS